MPSPMALVLTDLDQRPDYEAPALALFSAAGPGAEHQVCGLPAYMGLAPTRAILAQSAGVLVAVHGRRVAGALSLCPYSDEQITLWGPACAHGAPDGTAQVLIQAARSALQASAYVSMRTLIDTRNRRSRACYLAQGFTAWKDNHLYEHHLDTVDSATPARVRLALPADHAVVAQIFISGFPETDHCTPDLAQREQQGYRHYVLEMGERIVAAAALQDVGRRCWLKLVAMHPELRGRHLSRRLLDGVLAAEARRGTRSIALEVLADNRPAISLYEGSGFQRQWTATILIGPV
jgi:GNAT superfamily N-acetyltransferase